MFKKSFLLLLSLYVLSSATNKLFAQRERDEKATLLNFKGVQFRSPDSTFYVNFRFRMQSRMKYTTVSAKDFSADVIEARVRRLRMRFDGYIYNPKLSYSLQLAFTRGDQDYDETGVPNIVRDAIVFYNFTPNFYIGFGLNKLPGNRQRVISSGQQQFAERSIVNAALTIDRDFGLKAYYKGKLGDAVYHLKGALTTGEGRVANETDGGLAYTGRVELLPLGDFTDNGDYSEGDMEREKTPKISLAGGYSYNERTTRSGGQVGKYLYAPVSLGTWIFDAMFKYNGWALQTEYLKRTTDNAVTADGNGNVQHVFNGDGLNNQASYLFHNGIEVAGRYSLLRPNQNIYNYQQHTEVVEVGVTKYMREHRLKFQLNANYLTKEGVFRTDGTGNKFGAIFQIELGI